MVFTVEGQPAPEFVAGVPTSRLYNSCVLPRRSIDLHEIALAGHAVQDVGGAVVGEASNATRGCEEESRVTPIVMTAWVLTSMAASSFVFVTVYRS